MKKSIKLICFLLATLMVAFVFCGCKKKGMLLARYDGGEVYSNDEDVKEWTKYLTSYYYSYVEEGKMTKDYLGTLIIKTIVAQRIREIEVQKRGIEVTDEAVQNMYDYNKKAFDEQYKGGFDGMLKDSGLSKKFWMMFARNAVIEQLIANDLVLNKNFTDEELTEYYAENLSKYITNAGYTYTALFIEVKDISNDTEWSEQKAVAEKYIERLLSGEDFDKVKEEILKTYNEENGYKQTADWTGQGTVAFDEVYKIDDLDKALKEVDEKYSDRDPKADKSSEAYSKYLQYLATSMAYTQSYAMTTIKEGEIYASPIISPLGWMILRLDKIAEETVYPSLDEIRLQLIADYSQELLSSGELMNKFSDEMDELYHVEIQSFSFSD